jgi:hypothetical protein
MTTTLTPFDELLPGDFVCDMHDGPPRARFDIVAWVQWRTGPMPLARTPPGPVHAHTFGFPNKELHVLGARTGSAAGITLEGQLVCGYDYDGQFSGIVVLSEKEHP